MGAVEAKTYLPDTKKMGDVEVKTHLPDTKEMGEVEEGRTGNK